MRLIKEHLSVVNIYVKSKSAYLLPICIADLRTTLPCNEKTSYKFTAAVPCFAQTKSFREPKNLFYGTTT